MKLFSGFRVEGHVVYSRWQRISATEAGWVWVVTSLPVFGGYDGPVDWIGSEDGLELLELRYLDGAERRVYELTGSYSWYGELVAPEEAAGGRYPDRWRKGESEPTWYLIEGIGVHVLWEVFESAFQEFLTRAGGDLYLPRLGSGAGLRQPLTPEGAASPPNFVVTF